VFTHEKLIVYQRSIEWLTVSTKITVDLPPGNSELVNQQKRATLSILLNIAEEAGKVSRPDKQRFFAIARGSALECAAILDALRVLDVAEPTLLARAKELLYQIVSMLSALCRK